MKKRKLLAALAVGAALVVYLAVPTPSPVSHENFDRIEFGMRRARVESFLGKPGDYRTGPTDPPPPLNFDAGSADAGGTFDWCGDAGVITVEYDSADKVKAKRFEPLHRENASIFGDWLWRMRRTWRGWFN